MNTIQKILAILMVVLLCILGLLDVGARAFGPGVALQAQNRIDATCQQLLVNGDLEGTGGWQFGPTPAPATVVNNPVRAGAGAIRMGLADSASNVPSHSSAYQVVTLPASAPQLLLTYWERASGDSDGVDYREVLILRTNFTTLRSLTHQTTAGNSQWTSQTFDLTELAGQTVYLYFNVYNNGAGSRMNNYVDDIVLANCSDVPTDTPTAAASAASTATPVPPQSPTAAPTSTTLPTSVPTTTPQPTAAPGTDTMLLRVGSVEATGVSEVTVPLDIVSLPTAQNVGALSIDLIYDAARLSAASCSDSGAFDLLVCNLDEPGRIQLAALAATGVFSPTTLATVRFNLTDVQQSAAALSLRTDSAIDVTGADLATSTQNGQITFTCNPDEEPCGGNNGSGGKSNVFLPIMRR